MDFQRLFDILPYQEARYPQATAFSRVGKAFSTGEAIRKTEALAAALWHIGIQPGDRIAIIAADNCPEWHFCDFAIQKTGAVVVPIHAVATDAELVFILRDAGIRACFAASEALADRIRLAAPDTLEFLWAFEGEKALNAPLPDEETQQHLHNIARNIRDTDLATLIYTSGTTGEPKGVMLSHRNVVSNIKSVITLAPVDCTHRVFSFLPLSHIFERMVTYAYMAVGASIYYPEQAGTLMRDLRAARPHFFAAVPRVLEKFFSGIQATAAKRSFLQRRILQWAIRLGINYKTGKSVPLVFQWQLGMADLLVFRLWRRALGGKIKGVMVGAAALQPELGRLFSAAGISVREGYGLTESAPVVSFNRFEPGGVRFGTVGIPVPGVEVHIHQPDENGEGEIWVRGPNVMMGYYHRPEETREVLDAQGWLHTGDVGKWAHKRFLQITDRQKDLFKVSGGRYVAPQSVERALRNSTFIENCMACGADKPAVSALILPDFEQLKSWCEQQGIRWTAPQFMAIHPKVRRLMESEIERCNESLPYFARVRQFLLLHEPWTEWSGHLTPTLKLRRNRILDQYQKELEALYGKTR